MWKVHVMISKQEYHKLKNELKFYCKPNLLQLAKDVNLDDYETALLLCIYSNMSRVEIGNKLHIRETKCSNDSKKVLAKIGDYIKTTRL